MYTNSTSLIGEIRWLQIFDKAISIRIPGRIVGTAAYGLFLIIWHCHKLMNAKRVLPTFYDHVLVTNINGPSLGFVR